MSRHRASRAWTDHEGQVLWYQPVQQFRGKRVPRYFPQISIWSMIQTCFHSGWSLEVIAPRFALAAESGTSTNARMISFGNLFWCGLHSACFLEKPWHWANKKTVNSNWSSISRREFYFQLAPWSVTSVLRMLWMGKPSPWMEVNATVTKWRPLE